MADPRRPNPYEAPSNYYGQQAGYPPAPPPASPGGYYAEQPQQGFAAMSVSGPKGQPGGTGERLAFSSGRYQDVWAAVLFIIHIIAVHVIAIYLGIHAVTVNGRDLVELAGAPAPAPAAQAPAPAPAGELELKKEDLKWILASLGMSILSGILFALLWLRFILWCPRFMIRVSLWFSVFFCFACAVLFFMYVPSPGKFIGGVIFVLIGLLSIWYAYSVQDRIPFAAAMLEKVVSIVHIFPSVVVVSHLLLLINIIWTIVWSFGAAGVFKLSSGSWVVFLMLLSLYWTSEVIRNVVHVTSCGVYATFYFQQQSLPPNPTGGSFWRAVTSSFGSICLGSFIVAFLTTCKVMVQAAKNAAAENNEGGAVILLSCAECILSCLESLVQYFNKWAYVQVAVYGKGFVRASIDTWQLFASQGIDLLINDDLCGNVLSLGCLCGGITGATVGGLSTWIMGHHGHTEYIVAFAVVGFVFGILTTALTLSVIESGIATYYVCYAEDPAALQRNDPAFYEMLSQRHNYLRSSVVVRSGPTMMV